MGQLREKETSRPTAEPATVCSLERKRFSLATCEIPWANLNRAVVVVTGYFDVFHAGHVRFLEACAKPDELLVVGVHSDHLARKYKGNDRPRNKLEHRLMVVAALECVDFVFEADRFYDDDSGWLLSHLHPSVVVLSSGKGESLNRLRLRRYLEGRAREGHMSLRTVPIVTPVLFADALVRT